MGGGADTTIFHSVNSGPDGLAPTMRFLSDATDYGVVKLLLLAMVVAMIVASPRTRRAAVMALIAFPLADGLTNVLKKTFPVLRPCYVLPDWVNHGIGCTASAGTASAHSANMAAVATVFCYHLGWWGAPWVVVALLTGWSRVYVGAHYPTQVLLGWSVGVIVALVVIKAWESIQRRRRVVKPDKDET
jgi:undecaprenyl-diphosphatase